MSDSSERPSLTDSQQIVQRVIDPTQFVRTGWVEWYTERVSTYRERVVYRRYNPYWMGYFAAGLYGLLFLLGFGPLFFGVEETLLEATGRGPLGVYWGWLGVAASFSVAFAGSVYARLRTKTEERPREAAYYPPREYWLAVRGEEGQP